jgi:3,4-dihydroxy 2-butanone 4-phosphate synthase/GTP cyclohydrolase II
VHGFPHHPRLAAAVAVMAQRISLAQLQRQRQGQGQGQKERGGRQMSEGSGFNTVEEAVEAIAAGEMIVVVDDEDRENEGDLIMAASKASPAQVAFIIRHTSGILCTPMESQRARQLNLAPMVHDNDAPLSTAFTVSVDYRHGLTTGISAEERCNTSLALANSNVSADDFARPGHMFPLVARPGGVLVRSGHTEAAVDLARLAGLPPVGLISEIVNDDGTVKRLPELRVFAKEHGLKLISIADLIAYRQQREHLVERVAEFRMDTAAGPAQAYTYRTKFEATEHLVLVVGKPIGRAPALVRIHRERVLDDVFGSQAGFEQNLVDASLERIKAAGGGIFIYLRRGNGIGVANTNDKSSEADRLKQWLEIGIGAQILRDLGVSHIRLLAGRVNKYVGLRGFGIELVDTESLG